MFLAPDKFYNLYEYNLNTEYASYLVIHQRSKMTISSEINAGPNKEWRASELDG